MARRYPSARDRRDIGGVVLPIEKLLRARELSSSCVGVEAMLEQDANAVGDLGRRPGHHPEPSKDCE